MHGLRQSLKNIRLWESSHICLKRKCLFTKDDRLFQVRIALYYIRTGVPGISGVAHAHHRIYTQFHRNRPKLEFSQFL